MMRALKKVSFLPFKSNNLTTIPSKIKNLTVIYRHIFVQTLTCLILVVSSFAVAQAASNEDFGRLFSRPAERDKLDYLRQNKVLKLAMPEANQDEEIADAPLILPAPITMQGYVKRSDGSKSTLWINNQAVQEDSIVDDVNIGKLNQNSNKIEGLDVKIPASGKRIRLKAGQMYEPETNQIKELKIIAKEKQLNLQETGEVNANNAELD